MVRFLGASRIFFSSIIIIIIIFFFLGGGHFFPSIFFQNIDGFRPNNSQGFRMHKIMYTKPIRDIFFTIYQNYTLALSTCTSSQKVIIRFLYILRKYAQNVWTFHKFHGWPVQRGSLIDNLTTKCLPSSELGSWLSEINHVQPFT